MKKFVVTESLLCLHSTKFYLCDIEILISYLSFINSFRNVCDIFILFSMEVSWMNISPASILSSPSLAAA